MKFHTPFAFLVVAAATCALMAPAAARPGNGNGHGNSGGNGGAVAKGRPGAARLALTATDAAPDAVGKIDVKRFPKVGRREQREWLRVKASGLDAAATYTVWMDDPATVETDLAEVPDSTLGVETKDSGDVWTLRFDTKKNALPFSQALVDLAGDVIEIRNADGTAVLTGVVPEIAAKKKGK